MNMNAAAIIIVSLSFALPLGALAVMMFTNIPEWAMDKATGWNHTTFVGSIKRRR